MAGLERALERVESFSSPQGLTQRISLLERKMNEKDSARLKSILMAEGVDDSVLRAALEVKSASAQINVVIHAVGILVSLPYILEFGEKIRSLSLGAGNSGRDFDLETDDRVAEFKFIRWRGGPESIRQNHVFIDLFKLAEDTSNRRRCLYLIGKEHPIRFLNGHRSIDSVLSKNQAMRKRFFEKFGEKYSVVSQYYDDVVNLVDIIDLRDIVPAFSES